MKHVWKSCSSIPIKFAYINADLFVKRTKSLKTVNSEYNLKSKMKRLMQQCELDGLRERQWLHDVNLFFFFFSFFCVARDLCALLNELFRFGPNGGRKEGGGGVKIGRNIVNGPNIPYLVEKTYLKPTFFENTISLTVRICPNFILQ